MENTLAKRSSLVTPAKVLLAGVFLVAAFFAASALRNPQVLSFSGSEVAAGPGSSGGFGFDNAAFGAPSEESIQKEGPVRFIIPKLGIDSAIQYVGVTKEGNMDTPKSAVDVAWYKFGPKPGDAGNAVIAGHINTRYSSHGVFEHLDRLQTGDEVMVRTKDGRELKFLVTGKELLGHDASAEKVFGPIGGKHLNLVTCAGAWNSDKKIYEERLVVYTELAD